MDRSTQLQFKLMARDAQLAAVRRLALCGTSVERIAEYTGWQPSEVQRTLEILPPALHSPQGNVVRMPI